METAGVRSQVNKRIEWFSKGFVSSAAGSQLFADSAPAPTGFGIDAVFK